MKIESRTMGTTATTKTARAMMRARTVVVTGVDVELEPGRVEVSGAEVVIEGCPVVATAEVEDVVET